MGCVIPLCGFGGVWLLLVVLCDYEVACLFFGVRNVCDGVLSDVGFAVDSDCVWEVDQVCFFFVSCVLFTFASPVDVEEYVWSVFGNLAMLVCDVLLNVVFVWLDLSKVAALRRVCL